MKKHRIQRSSYLIVIFSLLSLLFLSIFNFVQARSIGVVTKQGESIPLYKDYQALVIGVSDYTYLPKLPNAVKDAEEVANQLEKMGFQVRRILDPTSQELRKEFDALPYKMGSKEDRALLIYFAGHGDTETLADKSKLGYILPKDTPSKIKNPDKYNALGIHMGQIEILAKRLKNRHVLMLFDSCFSGSIFALVRDVPTDVSEKVAKPVRQFITAGTEDEQVPDKSDFKKVFLDGIKGEADYNGDGYVTGSELGMYLHDKVVNYSRGSQHPQYGKIRNPELDKGDFVFILPQRQEKQVAGLAVEGREEADKFSIADLEKKSTVEKGKWEKKLNSMKMAFGETEKFEKKRGNPDLKTAAWQRFLETYKEKNPYSDDDVHLREKAEKQIRHWLEEGIEMAGKKTKKPEGQTVTVPGQFKASSSLSTHPELKTGMEMVFVKGGCYQMGDTFEDGDSDEKPVHEVCVEDFYLGKFKITQGMWQSVMGNNPSFFKSSDNYPVESVSWNDVQEFIRKLNEGTGKRYRLPTEAEWEYAARSGGKREKWAGTSNESELETYAWFAGNSGSKIHPVGEKRPNDFGLFDMNGNVWEWVEDIYSSNAYQQHSRINPVYTGTGSVRVIRSGSCLYGPGYVRATIRNGRAPDSVYNYLGFRLAVSK